MALRKTEENTNESLSGMKAKQVFSNKEKKVLMGLGWAAGVRFALKEFQKNHAE